MMHDLQDQYGGMVDFIYLDVNDDKTSDLQQKLNFAGTPPAVIFFDANGNEKGRFVGLHSQAEIETEIEDLVAVG